MDKVIQYLHQAVLRPEEAGRTEGELLASFIDRKDEAAFEALVRRQGRMVFGVCRRVAGNHHDAEDAFQATFLVLARKASSVRPRERLANWLHGVALRTAMKAKAMTAKRRGREKQVTQIPEPESPQQDPWRDLQPILDQELNGLPENYRLPILLCDLQGEKIAEAARKLGWPQGTVAGRLARGRKLLAKRLTNRGVGLSAGSLAAIVSQNALAVVPSTLTAPTVKAAILFGAGQAAASTVASAKVAALTDGVLKSMLLKKLKVVPVLLLLLAVAVLSGAVSLFYPTRAAEQPTVQADKDKQLVAGAQEKKDQDLIQGTWNVVKLEHNGKANNGPFREGIWVFKGKEITLRNESGKEWFKGTFVLDPDKKPKTIDITLTDSKVEKFKGKTQKGIYKIEKDTLILSQGTDERPKGFADAGKAGKPGLLTLERVKSE
jgi:RNA polymerase sigma-70 factor (ECF subfamily)